MKVENPVGERESLHQIFYEFLKHDVGVLKSVLRAGLFVVVDLRCKRRVHQGSSGNGRATQRCKAGRVRRLV